MKAWRRAKAGETAKEKCLEIIDRHKETQPLLNRDLRRIAKRANWVAALGACQRCGLK